MAAATASRRGQWLANTPEGYPTLADIDGSTKYLGGTLGTLNGSGQVIAYADGSQNHIVGLIKAEDDTSTETAGDRKVELWQGVVVKLIVSDTISAADVGKEVFAEDNQTVSLTQAGTESKIGKIVEVTGANEAFVYIYTGDNA